MKLRVSDTDYAVVYEQSLVDYTDFSLKFSPVTLEIRSCVILPYFRLELVGNLYVIVEYRDKIGKLGMFSQ